jgi:hypothetical protein
MEGEVMISACFILAEKTKTLASGYQIQYIAVPPAIPPYGEMEDGISRLSRLSLSLSSTKTCFLLHKKSWGVFWGHAKPCRNGGTHSLGFPIKNKMFRYNCMEQKPWGVFFGA